MQQASLSLLDTDYHHLLHPYTDMMSPQPVELVTSASGCRLTLADGRELIDGMSSWWAAIHGYNHPRLNQALTDQTKSMAHVMFGGLTHEPAIRLCRQLLECVPEGLEKVFLCDSGSVSVEVSIKMAIQYWYSQGLTEKKKFASTKKQYLGNPQAYLILHLIVIYGKFWNSPAHTLEIFERGHQCHLCITVSTTAPLN